MALTIKDGAGSTTSLKTTLTGSDHMPHHIVQAVSGTVNVSASAASPVYVTGNVSVNQPISVDVDISDKLTVTVSGTAYVTSSQANPVYVTGNMQTTVADGLQVTASISNTPTITGTVHVDNSYFAVTASAISPVYVTGSVNIGTDVTISGITTVTSSQANPVWITGSVSGLSDVTASVINTVTVTSSLTNPVIAQLGNIATTGIPNGATALVVSLSGSTGSFNQVQLYDSYVTVANTGTDQLIGYLTAAIDLGDSDYRLKVITTGSSAVTINNNAADAAFTALSYSFAENSIKVKLTGSNTVKEGAYDILLVRGTGSDAYVSNDGFNQAIYALTGSFTGDALKIKITGSNVVNEGGYDVVLAKTLSGSQTTINNTSFDQVLNFVTASYNAGDNVGKFNVQLTGTNNVNVTNTPNVSASIINFPAVQLVALSGNTTIFDANTNSTGSAVGLIGTSNYVTLYNSTASVTSSKTNPVYVMSEDDKPVYITNTINNPIIVTSSTDYPVYTYEKPVSGSITQRYDTNDYDWTTSASGTFVVASTDTNRKSLYIFNPTEHDLYVVVGLRTEVGFVNGFLLNTTSSAPELYSFIVYPQGKYSADQHAATQYHACFFPSGSDMTLSKVFVTRIGQ